MELRLKELRKKQDDLIQEIEQAVYKRESIQLKYSNKEKMNKLKGAGASKPKIKRRIHTLKKTLQQTTQKAKKYTKVLKEKAQEMQRLQSNLTIISHKDYSNHFPLLQLTSMMKQNNTNYMKVIFRT